MAGTRATGPPRRLHVEGVVVRHQRHCPAPTSEAAACLCRPGFQAQVWSARDHKTIRKTFPTVTEALAWRQEAKVSVHTGHLRAVSPTTLAEAAEGWLERAATGVIRTRSGDPYKPAAIRAYRHALDCRILPTSAINASPI
jgi:hypothetical protein